MQASTNISYQLIHIQLEQENNWDTRSKSTVLGLFPESEQGCTHEVGEQ